MIRDLEAKMAELLVAAPPPQELKFLCDTQAIKEHITRLGEIVQLEIPIIPPMPAISDYAAFQQPIIAVGKFGSNSGEFKQPRGVSVQTKSRNIYVADMDNNRIQIFSETGDYLSQFGQQYLNKPYGILIHLDDVYVTDMGHHSIFLFKLPELRMIKRVGKRGSGIEEFNFPSQLAISPNQHLYIPDDSNHIIQILSTNLAFQGSVKHQTMTRPLDVKFSHNEMFVLSHDDSPCIHIFSLSGRSPAT